MEESSVLIPYSIFIALAKKVKLKGRMTQKNLGTNMAIKMTATIEIKKNNQNFPVDFAVSIGFKSFGKIKELSNCNPIIV